MRTVIASSPSPDAIPFIWVHTFWSEEIAEKVADWLTGQGYKVMII